MCNAHTRLLLYLKEVLTTQMIHKKHLRTKGDFPLSSLPSYMAWKKLRRRLWKLFSVVSSVSSVAALVSLDPSHHHHPSPDLLALWWAWHLLPHHHFSLQINLKKLQHRWKSQPISPVLSTGGGSLFKFWVKKLKTYSTKNWHMQFEYITQIFLPVLPNVFCFCSCWEN